MWVKGLDALCIALLATSAQALYEDQAGQYDWYKPMIGHATTGCYSTSAQYMILGTDSNVLSAMSADGEIVWRHVMPVEQEMDLIVCDNVRVATVSANGSYIRMWSAKTGELIWERYSGAKKDEGQVGVGRMNVNVE
ncbi:hypothetical protein SARC_03212 [Sphaeroforma arctica JP610]|uniref:EMC1 first beta-propeller domain-containing protein n=1 Tax=Sphaeroforma arctica JP610 TaxID=667725 RepID=A0A0L0G6M2_9EUKA|nr:hypothetical protein SARC_03212 [Sphaeroforma arctica JP610]KNC84569.1 hypothetical protein SARC_03212 [Sphaeroforma arctica JP610]|eukprot:XP_014158471.1 hypothetical protein SARC_03212 [Sphaeroforma arctica JP610]